MVSAVFKKSRMSKIGKSTIVFSIFFAQLLPIHQASYAANPDDGYPIGEPAPGRTCPSTDVGATTVSSHSGKTFVCTLINGEKKWWIAGEALPSAPSPAKPGSTTNSSPEIQYTPKYKLAAKSIAKMKIFENVTYGNKFPSQRLDIYLPKGVTKPPLLIWSHGGGFVIGDEDFMKFDEILITNHKTAAMTPD